jgi:hypothetical protein
MEFRSFGRGVVCCIALLTALFAVSGVSSASDVVHRGRVTKVLKAEDFTYVKCLDQGKVKWVALSGRRTIYPGDVVEYSEVAPLPDASSRLAGMTFKEVEFAPEPRIYHNDSLVGSAGNVQPGNLPTTQAQAPMSRDDFSKMMSQTIDDPSFFKNPFRKGTGIYEIYKRYAHGMVTDNTIVDFLYGNFTANYGHVSDYQSYGKALVTDTVMKGMLRLNEGEFEELVRIINRMRGKLPVKDAARLVRNKLKFDVQWLELLSEEDATRYLELTRKALLAEITRTPIMPMNSEDQKNAGLEALMLEVKRRLTLEQQLRYERIFSNLEMAENDEVCWAYDVMLDSLFKLPEQPRHWMIREIANPLRGN